MSTRAVFTFTSGDETYHVYKHHDGYPSGAFEALEMAKGNAWQLNRFEPDEFAAAFVAANKSGPGGVRLLKSGTWKKVSPVDIEYHYTVKAMPNGHVHVFVECVDHDYDTGKWTVSPLFDTPLKKPAIPADYA